MGFPRDKVIAALQQTSGSLEQATDLLVQQMNAIQIPDGQDLTEKSSDESEGGSHMTLSADFGIVKERIKKVTTQEFQASQKLSQQTGFGWVNEAMKEMKMDADTFKRYILNMLRAERDPKNQK